MKKILMLMAAMLCSISSFAQFTVYEPVYAPSRSTTSSRNIYDPFTVYEPILDTKQPPVQKQPKVQTLTLKGYYQKSGKWLVTPIKVAISDDSVILTSVKSGQSWVTCNAAISEVNWLDPKIAQDNFTFKASYYMFGTIYF